ncbi:MAG: DEAD/DEAH box helicase [Candidatus Heimdallarchaeota archaeon]|nr:MAG: DEAD/DEAH box helicase [Candidatus Heimdallarchaeota archaeon]
MSINDKKLEFKLWDRFNSALENYKEVRDLDEVLTEFRSILTSEDPVPPVELLTELAKYFQKLKQINDAKKAYGRILEIDSSHRETWKELSTLYFKLKDIRRGEFCLQKYYTLVGGNTQLQKATELRLASSGRLKTLPSNKELGLQNGLKIKKSAPKCVINLSEFENHFQIPAKNLPSPIQKIIQFTQHQIVDYRLFEKQKGQIGVSVDVLGDTKLIEFLKKRRISQFFEFQQKAIETIQKNQDVCIVAPTGNGKTEAFLIPTLLKIREFKDCGVQLLLVYPMKALAKDQLRKIEEITDVLGLSVRVFDGDTSHYRRKKIFADPPEVLITNPDILHFHMGIGKNASKFQDLLAGVKIVILDEIHSYCGSFGSNMFFILRRLERIANSKLQFIGASATVANAESFASKLLNRPITVIECKNGQRGRLHFMMLAPFEGVTTLESTTMLINSIRNEGKILVFQDSHRNVERLYQKLGGAAKGVGLHRAGLDRKMREQMECNFREGVIQLLIATPTLELGIDIGDLDIVVTPPIAVNRAMQRIGRAGRKGQEALAIVLLNAEDPISKYYYIHPERYYQDIEDVFIDPDNPNVIEYQLLSAALDLPIDVSEFPEFAPILRKLVDQKLLHQVDSLLLPTTEGIEQARKFSIRGKNHEILIKLQGGKTIGKRAMPLAMLELYPGAFYYGGGTRYQVKNFYFNGTRGLAELIKPKSVWGQTFPLSSLKPEIIKIIGNHYVFGVEVAYVETKILQTVFGYTQESPNGTSMHKLRDPLYYSTRSKGLLFRAPPLTTDMFAVDRGSYTAALHTLVHTILHASLPFIGGQLNEIGGLALIPQGYVLLFDQANGSGVCAMLLDHLSELFARANDILECDCKDPQGCPRCTFLPRCQQKNTKLDKFGARVLLTCILDDMKVPLDNKYNSFTHSFH